MKFFLLAALLFSAAPISAQFGGGGGAGGGGGLQPANNLSDVANAATSAHNLGLGTADSPSFTGVTVSGVSGSTQCLQVNSSGVVAGSGGACGGGTPGTPDNSLQYKTAGASTFSGDSLFLVQPSSVGVYQPIQLSSNTTIGQDTGHCGALLNIGTTGTQCGTQGNNFTNDAVLVHNNGGIVVALRDTSDSNEQDIGIDNTGAWVGPIPGSIAMAVRVAATPVIRLGTGAGHNVTVGALVQNDAGTNASLYINNPSTAAVGGMIYASVASTNTIANTNEIGLYETALPAGIFKNNGDCLEMTCGAAGAATATTKELRIRFNNATLSAVGGTNIADTGAVTTNNADLDARVRICKSGSNTQVVVWSDNQAAGTIGILPAPPAPAATDTAAINVSCTCQNGTANSADCVGKGFFIEYKPAP